MRVAVLGGTGFVGRYIVDELLRQGHSVNVLIRPGSGHKAPESDNCAFRKRKSFSKNQKLQSFLRNFKPSMARIRMGS